MRCLVAVMCCSQIGFDRFVVMGFKPMVDAVVSSVSSVEAGLGRSAHCRFTTCRVYKHVFSRFYGSSSSLCGYLRTLQLAFVDYPYKLGFASLVRIQDSRGAVLAPSVITGYYS